MGCVNWTAVAPVGDRQCAAPSCCQCISAQIEHNSDRCHGPPPQQKTKNTTEPTEGQEGSHPERSSRCPVQQTSHGSPMLALCFLFFLVGSGGQDKVGMGLPCWLIVTLKKNLTNQGA